MNFKENLKKLMKEKNVKNIDLANILQINKSNITYYLQGKQETNLESLEKIKNFLACSYDDLLK